MSDEPACRFTITRPPSTNALYANVPGKGRVKTKRYREWIELAGWEIKLACPGRLPYFGHGLRDMLIEGVSGIDTDNVKAVPDLLKRLHIIPDDKLIDMLRIKRGGGGDHIVVSIWPMGD